MGESHEFAERSDEAPICNNCVTNPRTNEDGAVHWGNQPPCMIAERCHSRRATAKPHVDVAWTLHNKPGGVGGFDCGDSPASAISNRRVGTGPASTEPMKPLLIGERDYYSARLFRLEESRGHILSEQEYAALRRETLDELAAAARRPAFTVCAVCVALLGCAAGIGSILSVSAAVLLGIAICSSISGIVAAWLVRGTSIKKSASDRLEMLASLREHKLVTDVEFSTLRERLQEAA